MANSGRLSLPWTLKSSFTHSLCDSNDMSCLGAAKFNHFHLALENFWMCASFVLPFILAQEITSYKLILSGNLTSNLPAFQGHAYVYGDQKWTFESNKWETLTDKQQAFWWEAEKGDKRVLWLTILRLTWTQTVHPRWVPQVPAQKYPRWRQN